jgi:hypothetical protein
MTKQEVFDRVVTHLLTQKKRSASYYGSCLYKGPDGLRCAVGCLFPDSYDTSKIEGSGCVSRDVVSPLSTSPPTFRLTCMLTSLNLGA